ncbi:hypothetical protein T11_18106 [Trichinella zimbabwensis]|uniref:Uncharacterized protein n=1 Tax=Trichinella zimbabwensis TaxID=268475 RepID=A0A0V1H091_9BILA|nr:hypothetical protein T11_18106 [Trichinella zimbabwensis]
MSLIKIKSDLHQYYKLRKGPLPQILYRFDHFIGGIMMGRRAEEEKVENYQNFCISAAAEQMVSVEEKFSQQ